MRTGILGDICSTLLALLNVPNFRIQLVPQFGAVFSGFYHSSLILLWRLPDTINGSGFHANQFFDAKVEIILEVLIDLLCLQDDDYVNNHGGVIVGTKGINIITLKTLFSAYYVSPHSSKVALRLVVEMC